MRWVSQHKRTLQEHPAEVVLCHFFPVHISVLQMFIYLTLMVTNRCYYPLHLSVKKKKKKHSTAYHSYTIGFTSHDVLFGVSLALKQETCLKKALTDLNT